MYQPLSVDTIIESCLILMVLLLLTCARHLIVDCTALKSPIYPVTISQQRPLGGALSAKLFSTASPPPSPFSELSSKCHSVCYKSCNSSLCLRVVAFCAETRQPGGRLSPFSLPRLKMRGKKTKNKTTNKHFSGGWSVVKGESPSRLVISPLGASWLSLSHHPPPTTSPRQTSCIHPFRHPSVRHPSIG